MNNIVYEKKLTDDQIEIWQVDFTEDMFLKLNAYFYVLSKEERCNANSFKIDYHKRFYILSRIILRLLLSKYIDIAPELINIHKNKYGKPFIKPAVLNFNISHSHQKLVVGISKCKVGIDIEYVDLNFNFSEIIDIVLSANEKKIIKKLDYPIQYRQFFRYWTQKEALLKAIGIGLNLELHTIEIPYNNEFYSGNSYLHKIKKWYVVPFNSFSKNYIGHIAYKNKNSKMIRYYNCNELNLS